MRLWYLLIGILALGGCTPMDVLSLAGGGEKFILGHLGAKTKVKIRTLAFSASLNANNNFPTHVHLVLVFDPHMIAYLLKIPAKDYFKRWKQLVHDHHLTLQVHPFQIAPGDNRKPVAIHYSGSPTAAFVFADYKLPGDHRIRLGQDKHILILLDEKDFTAIPDPGDE